MISYNYSTKTITVDSTTTLREVYSDAMSTFALAAQMDDLVPLRADTPTLFTLISGWVFSSGSIQYLTSGALQDSSGDNIWCNVQSIGSLAEGTTLYIEQGGTVTFTAGVSGHINTLLKVRNNGTDIASKNATVYARKFQNTYDQFSFTGGAFVQVVPLATASDINLDIDQATIDAYTGLTIEWFGTPFQRDAGDGQGLQDYEVLIKSTSNHSLKQIYNWVQSQLLKSTDIDSGTGTQIGQVTSELIQMAGSTIFTESGIWIEGFASADANNIQYKDILGVTHTPPLSIAITVNADAALDGGRVVVYRLNGAYNPATYTPANIVATLLNVVLSGGQASTSLTYVADWPVVIRVRKAGYQPFELATTLTNAGLNVTAQNPIDSIYQA